MRNYKRTYDLIILGHTTEAIAAALIAAKMSLHIALVDEVNQEHESPCSAVMFHHELALQGVDIYPEAGCFLNSNIVIAGDFLLHAEKIIIATGSKALRPASFDFDGRQVLDVDEALTLQTLPQTMLIAGDDHAGLVAAQNFASQGVAVTLVAPHCPQDLPANINYRKGEVLGTEVQADHLTIIQLTDGQKLSTEMVVVNMGRVGQSESLNLFAADLMADDRGKLWCNNEYQTWQPNIFGLGDIAGVWDNSHNLQTIVTQMLKPAETHVLATS